MKKKKIKKVGLITKMPREKFHMSFGHKPTDSLKKTVRTYNINKNKYGFARILTKEQYKKIKSKQGKHLTISQVKKIVGR